MARYPFATFASRLPEDRRDVFAAFAGALPPHIVLAHVRSQRGLAVPRAAPFGDWRKLA